MIYMEEARISGLPGCVSVLTILYGSQNDLNSVHPANRTQIFFFLIKSHHG